VRGHAGLPSRVSFPMTCVSECLNRQAEPCSGCVWMAVNPNVPQVKEDS
jgi:hypothetical protein